MKSNAMTLTLLGLAGAAALGAVLGSSGHKGKRNEAEEDEDMELAHRDTLSSLIERYARALPENEAEIMLRRNRSRLRDW